MVFILCPKYQPRIGGYNLIDTAVLVSLTMKTGDLVGSSGIHDHLRLAGYTIPIIFLVIP